VRSSLITGLAVVVFASAPPRPGHAVTDEAGRPITSIGDALVLALQFGVPF
jgi:hypothetical protein